MGVEKMGVKAVLSEFGEDTLAHFNNIHRYGQKDPRLETNLSHVQNALNTFLEKRKSGEFPDSELACVNEDSPPVEDIARSIAIRKALALEFQEISHRIYCDYIKPHMETDPQLIQSLLNSSEGNFRAIVGAIIAKDVRIRIESIPTKGLKEFFLQLLVSGSDPLTIADELPAQDAEAPDDEVGVYTDFVDKKLRAIKSEELGKVAMRCSAIWAKLYQHQKGEEDSIKTDIEEVLSQILPLKKFVSDHGINWEDVPLQQPNANARVPLWHQLDDLESLLRSLDVDSIFWNSSDVEALQSEVSSIRDQRRDLELEVRSLENRIAVLNQRNSRILGLKGINLT